MADSGFSDLAALQEGEPLHGAGGSAAAAPGGSGGSGGSGGAAQTGAHSPESHASSSDGRRISRFGAQAAGPGGTVDNVTPLASTGNSKSRRHVTAQPTALADTADAVPEEGPLARRPPPLSTGAARYAAGEATRERKPSLSSASVAPSPALSSASVASPAVTLQHTSSRRLSATGASNRRLSTGGASVSSGSKRRLSHRLSLSRRRRSSVSPMVASKSPATAVDCRDGMDRSFRRTEDGGIDDGVANAAMDVLEIGSVPLSAKERSVLARRPPRGRRRSTIQVSKASEVAAKQLANRWGGKLSIKRVVSTKTRPSCILSPGSRFMRRWDTLTLLCLIIVAVVTPFELAFLKPDPDDAVFILNRCIDVVFILDIVFTFFLEYRDTDTMLWIYDYKMIAKRYLKSWFLIDFVSVLPFDIVSQFLESGGVRNLQLIRILRVAKLAKLARVMRLARIHARWERDLDVPFATLALAKFAVYMITLTHWFACLWGFLGSVQTDTAEEEDGFTTIDTSWLQFYDYHTKSAVDKYLVSVHWAMQTVSTIGYGDIRAVTTLERFVCCLCMAYGASVWTYVVASVCGIVTSLDPHGTHRKHTIAAVNEFMQTKSLPKRWRPRLRAFFISRENFHRTLASRRLLRLMSPALRGEVARELNSVWIHRVPYLRQVSDGLVTKLAMTLEQEFFAPEEFIRSDCLHILEKGVCMQASRIIPTGFVWGEDMILNNPLLRNTTTATFFHTLSFFPDDRKLVIAAANWITVRRKLLMWMATIRDSGEDVEAGILTRLAENKQERMKLRQQPLRLLAAATAGSDIRALLAMSTFAIAQRNARESNSSAPETVPIDD